MHRESQQSIDGYDGDIRTLRRRSRLYDSSSVMYRSACLLLPVASPAACDPSLVSPDCPLKRLVLFLLCKAVPSISHGLILLSA